MTGVEAIICLKFLTAGWSFQPWKICPTPCTWHGWATEAELYSPTQIPVGFVVGERCVMCSILLLRNVPHPSPDWWCVWPDTEGDRERVDAADGEVGDVGDCAAVVLLRGGGGGGAKKASSSDVEKTGDERS